MKLRVEPSLCVRDNGPLDSGTISVISSDHIAAARAREMADPESCQLLRGSWGMAAIRTEDAWGATWSDAT